MVHNYKTMITTNNYCRHGLLTITRLEKTKM